MRRHGAMHQAATSLVPNTGASSGVCGGYAGELMFTNTKIGPAEMAAANTTPVLLVAAPLDKGAFLQYCGAVLYLDYGGAAFVGSGSGADLAIGLGVASSFTTCSETVGHASFMDATADVIFVMQTFVTGTTAVLTNFTNQPLRLAASEDSTYVDVTSHVYVTTFYRIVNTLGGVR